MGDACDSTDASYAVTSKVICAAAPVTAAAPGSAFYAIQLTELDTSTDQSTCGAPSYTTASPEGSITCFVSEAPSVCCGRVLGPYVQNPAMCLALGSPGQGGCSAWR